MLVMTPSGGVLGRVSIGSITFGELVLVSNKKGICFNTAIQWIRDSG